MNTKLLSYCKYVVFALIFSSCEKMYNSPNKLTENNAQTPNKDATALLIDSLSKIPTTTKSSFGLTPSVTRIVVSNDTVMGTCSKLEIKIWGDYVYGEHNDLTVAVDAGFVLVGGGARVTNTSNTDVGVAAVLVSAFPVNDGTFTAYRGKSKDHKVVYNHRLWVYAIGIKLIPCDPHVVITPSTLIPYLSLTSVTSSSSEMPYAAVNIPTTPTGYTALSGGADINYGVNSPGNLLVEDGEGLYGNPSSSTNLGAKGKDQYVVSFATITSYCLAIQTNISLFGFGGLYFNQKVNSIANTGHSQSISQSVDAGWLISGIGAATTYAAGGYGRLLYAMYPTSGTNAIASDKDLIVTDISGFTTLEVTEIKPN